MANRPCNPDADMKRLWQLLLPGTPVPACGVSGDGEPGRAHEAGPSGRPPKLAPSHPEGGEA
jgi:hypothetical protein